MKRCAYLGIEYRSIEAAARANSVSPTTMRALVWPDRKQPRMRKLEIAKAYRERNKVVINARTAKWRKARRLADPVAARECDRLARERNPEAARRASRESGRRAKGLPAPPYPPPERCECCGRVMVKPHLDHCHLTGKFRGWLCGQCNQGLGLFGDTLAGARKAVAYLERVYEHLLV